jgi:DeoR/GlpR family transcriptional regulator of sugar metabolism
MLKNERHELILNEVEQKGRVLVNELTNQLNVTEDTIRKDLRELSTKGLLKRVHGGALSTLKESIEFQTRLDYNAEKKEKLAEVAIKLIGVTEAEVIFIDGGTTNLKFAEKIPRSFKGRVITNSPSIALELSNHPNVSINLLGGDFNKTSRITSGSSTLKQIQEIHADLYVLGISSIDSDYGITVPSYEESLIKRQFLLQSSSCIGIVTTDKLEKISTFFVESVIALDYLVIEKNVNQNIIKLYKEKGIKIVE